MTLRGCDSPGLTLVLDDGEATLFVMACVACGFFGPKGQDVEDGAEWAVQHLALHPDHLAYREHITRAYRFEAGAAS
ncbi:hypothetical protein [Streptomyces profundus]|uniref:DUF7848 domain-containing protein n=1 Tax=Streptomyces profundus TaxID=2867410 RepID=UPI001D16080D|nr:hypothetical protein [Streptomyces sp. MA3_2.13]UED85123.1 hypothetical protein K4G22_13715 [Streptomyces sp. MA3_2.13]